MNTAKNYYDNYEVVVPENDDYDLEYIDLNEEDVIDLNPEEVLKIEVQREKKLREALLNLISKEASLSKEKLARMGRETRAEIGKIIKGVKEKAQLYEKGYLEEKAILENYEKRLIDLESMYEEGRKLRDANKKGHEKKEREAINEKSKAKNKIEKMKATKEYRKYIEDVLKVMEEFQKAIESGDFETEQIKRKELMELKQKDPTGPYKSEMNKADKAISLERENISALKGELIAWDKQKNDSLDKIEHETNQAFSGMAKQNFWQKLIGSVVNKFHKVGKVANSAFGRIKKITDMMAEQYDKMNKEFEEQLKANIQKETERAEAKAKARAERKAARAEKIAVWEEEIGKYKQDIIISIDERIAATEEQLKLIRAPKVQSNEKNMLPVFEAGNDGVKFARD